MPAPAATSRLRHALPAGALIAAVCVGALTAGGGGSAQGLDPYRVQVIQTTANLSQRLTPRPGIEFGDAKLAGNEPVIGVDAGVRYQRVRGFGAAMTDSSAWLIERKLPASARRTLMRQLFAPSGIHLDFVKVPIGASDFTHDGRPYTYDDLPSGRTDPSLAHFSIAHDHPNILPALRQVRALNPATTFLATPWSPPAWMKSNHSLDNAGNRGRLLARDDRAWARYFVKFIRAYARAGISIGALTIQNEPGVATLYPGLNLPAPSAVRWVRRYLRPALAAARLHPRIYGGDLGWGPSTDYAAASVRAAGGALHGLAWHCYYGAPTVMRRFHRSHPRLDAIVDECSPGISPTPHPRGGDLVAAQLGHHRGAVEPGAGPHRRTGGAAQPRLHGLPGAGDDRSQDRQGAPGAQLLRAGSGQRVPGAGGPAHRQPALRQLPLPALRAQRGFRGA